jgi:hypothetical protein
VFCGWEIGQQIKTGNTDLKEQLTSDHPVFRAYELYNNFKGRASWDQVTAFLLTEESSRYFELDNKGTCHLRADASNCWIPGERGKQFIVRIKKDANLHELAGKITDLMLGKNK